MPRTDSTILLPTLLVLVACRAGQSAAITSAELQVTDVRCEQNLHGQYLDGPIACHSALDRYLHRYSSERIASVIPVAPWPPHRYYGALQPDETASLLVLHTARSGPWPLAKEIVAYGDPCEHDAGGSSEYDCGLGPGPVDEPDRTQVYFWVSIENPSERRGGTTSLLQVAAATYPVPPPSSWPTQAIVERSRIPCVVNETETLPDGDPPRHVTRTGPDACEGALEQFLGAHPTEHIGPVFPVVTAPQDPLHPGTQVLFVEHTAAPAPWPTADQLAIVDVSCFEHPDDWDCASALDDHRQSGIAQWIPLIAECHADQLCTRDILYLFERDPRAPHP